MEVRLTSSARSHLLEAVVRLRDRDRGRALSLVRRTEETLWALAQQEQEDHDLDIAEAISSTPAGDRLRLYYRVRGDTLWVLAVW